MLDSDDRRRPCPSPSCGWAPDYGASSLWTIDGNIPIEDLPLSPRLNAELHQWAKEFDATTPKRTRMKRAGYVPTDWTTPRHKNELGTWPRLWNPTPGEGQPCHVTDHPVRVPEPRRSLARGLRARELPRTCSVRPASAPQVSTVIRDLWVIRPHLPTSGRSKFLGSR